VLIFLKNMAGHRDAECVEGNEGKRECGGGISLPNGLGGHVRERCSSPSGAPAEN